MKKKQLNSLRGKKTSDLQKMVNERKLELIKLGAERKVGKGKNVKKSKNLKHEIAQILTVLREKEISKSEKQA